jgi:kynurenine/2-aminoadipate aminotransferase
MFLWIEILGVHDSADLIYSKAVKEKVILVPGFEFYPNSHISNHVRAAYSMATLEEMDLGLKRLGELIRSIKKE